jgi:hypothetical protein
MNDFLSDEELDAMIEGDNQGQAQMVPMPPPQMPEPVPLYSLALASAGNPVPQQAPVPNGQQPNGNEGILNKQVGPLPAWAWGLIGLGVAGTGYFAYRSTKKVSENSGGDGDSKNDSPSIGQVVTRALTAGTNTDSFSGWQPSRSRFAEQLERYYQRKGQSQFAKVWVDAEDAKDKGKLKFVSPLVNIEVKDPKVVKVDQGLTRFCRREGLDPKPHPDGSIGLYPHSSKRGKEWEEYIDALRDDGQQV